MIFANDADSGFPKGAVPLGQSAGTVKITSSSGQWYNFAVHFPYTPNTVYWLGYYSDNYAPYYFDNSASSVSVTSQPKDEGTSFVPVRWMYSGKAVMSLYAVYTLSGPEDPVDVPLYPDSTVPQSAQTIQDTLPVMLIIAAEAAFAIGYKFVRKKRTFSKRLVSF